MTKGRNTHFLAHFAKFAKSAQNPKTLKLFNLSGAPERKNLELPDPSAVLSELEAWSDVLKAEPEVLRTLSAFERAADDAQGRDDNAALSPPEPSP